MSVANLLLVVGVLVLGSARAQEDDWDPINTFRQEEFVRNIDHMKEHMGEDFQYDMDGLPPEELEFHFFQMHDLNEDYQLDGLEILTALRHGAHDHYERILQKGAAPEETRRQIQRLNDRLAHTVDVILSEDDTNDDGYLTYPEYAQSRRANVVLDRVAAEMENTKDHTSS